MRPIRWGILSTGMIAKNFAEVAQKLGGEVVVEAVASRTRKDAEAFAAAYGIPKAYGSYEALAEDPDVDIVYVATPHSRHYEDMMLLLRNGKHVLCEKSFTVSAAQAQAVYDCARGQNLLVVEAFWTKFLPIYREVERRVASGVIGDIRLVTAQYGYTTAREARKFDPALAGGALLDIGVYCIGFAAMILGYEPEEIGASLLLNRVGTDAYDAVTLRYDGAMAQLTSAIGANVPVFGGIYGTKGRIEIPNFKNPQRFTLLVDGREPETFELPFDVNGYEYQMREAQECLRAGRTHSEIMTPGQSVAVMRIMDEVRRQGGLRFPFEVQG